MSQDNRYEFKILIRINDGTKTTDHIYDEGVVFAQGVKAVKKNLIDLYFSGEDTA